MATKKLSDRVDEAAFSLGEVSEAIEGADGTVDEIKEQLKRLTKAVGALRKVIEDVTELFDDVTDAISSIESKVEDYEELKLSKQIDVLGDVQETLEEIEFGEDE